MGWISAIVVTFMLGVAQAQPVQPEHGFGVKRTPTVHGQHFMIATAHPLATKIGHAILAEGGTVADAAVAAQTVLGLVEPQSSGLGGGSFAMIYDHQSGLVTSLDGRETAPRFVDDALFTDKNGKILPWKQAVPGGRSVGVPGTVDLLDKLHQRLGQLPVAKLLEPAQKLAENGFAVTPRLHNSLKKSATSKTPNWGLLDHDGTAEYFFDAHGKPWPIGHILKNPEYAATLATLRLNGLRYFYDGTLAGEIAKKVQTYPIQPGTLSFEDMRQYEAKWRDPICFFYRDHQVCSMGPPSSGGLTMGQILGMIEPFDMKEMGPSVDAFHILTEASRLAFADRAKYMADADFVPVPIRGLLDKNYLKSRSKEIKRFQSIGKAKPGEPPQQIALWGEDNSFERPGTTHMVIYDQYGNALSMTSSIETGFGSRIFVGGMLLNNQLTDFSFQSKRDGRPIANAVAPYKRPRSSMTPVITLEDGKPHILLGSPGGSRIIGYVTLALINMIDWGLEPTDALNMGHIVNRNGKTEIEKGSGYVFLGPRLEARGHSVSIRDMNSGLGAIIIDHHGLRGATDMRREGLVLTD